MRNLIVMFVTAVCFLFLFVILDLPSMNADHRAPKQHNHLHSCPSNNQRLRSADEDDALCFRFNKNGAELSCNQWRIKK